jgi:formate hydrogenlyase subunit 3/multisubunit Na+/H+ antiporter MnhD subunit
MTPNSHILFLLLSPLIGVLLLPLKPVQRNLFYCLLVLIPVANISLLGYYGEDATPFNVGYLSFSLDRYSIWFCLLLNSCWITTIIYSSDFVKFHFQERAATFFGYFSIAVSLITGTGLSDNLLTLDIFYTFSIPVIYPLVTFRQSEDSTIAGRWYFYSTMGPALLILLPCLIYINQWITPFQNLSIKSITDNDYVASSILFALIVGLSKNCVAPFNSWLPLTSVAPAPVSGLVHSVGAVHTGSIAVLKIIVYLYGYEYMQHLSSSFLKAGWLIYLCGFTALYTAVCAYRTPDLKKRFSYSTVGQVSYVITAGLIGTPSAVFAAMLHIVSHSIAKLNLFFVAGYFNSLYGTVHAPDVGKLIPSNRWLAIPIAFSGLSITGFPLLAGHYGKEMMLWEEFSQHQYAAAAFLLVGSIINFLYIYPVLRAAFRKNTSLEKPSYIPSGLSIAIAINVLLLIMLSFFDHYIVSHH